MQVINLDKLEQLSHGEHTHDSRSITHHILYIIAGEENWTFQIHRAKTIFKETYSSIFYWSAVIFHNDDILSVTFYTSDIRRVTSKSERRIFNIFA